MSEEKEKPEPEEHVKALTDLWKRKEEKKEVEEK